MAITMLLMGLASDIWQLHRFALVSGNRRRVLVGATILVAVQARNPVRHGHWVFFPRA